MGTEFKMEPPSTRRPDGHPLVTALEADNVAAAFLSRMVDGLGPGDWLVPTPNGFWWVPWRLRHKIEIIEGVFPDDTPFLACRSTFTLVEHVQDVVQALEMCNYLNQRPLGAVAWYDHDTAEIKFTSSVHLSAARWFDAAVFFHVVQRLVGLAERLAPRLAEWANGRAPDTTHPTLGRRSSPDQFIEEAALIFRVPEAGTGIWWSKDELLEFRYALRYLLVEHGHDRAASAIDINCFDAQATTVDNLTQNVDLDLPEGPARLWIWPAEHHEVGNGIEVLLQTRVTFAGERDPSARPDNTAYALSAANALNSVSAELADHPLSIGAWNVWRGQLSYSLFLAPEVIRIVQSLAVGCAGTVMALMSTAVTGRCVDLRMLLAQDEESFRNAFGPCELADDYLWGGVEMNAGLMSLYIDSGEVFARVTEGLPTNEIFDPIELDDDAWMMQHNEVLLRMGIFNPIGPTVGTIEVAINYQTQQALLLERSRHPFSPTLNLYAVLDRKGFDRRAEYIEAMLPRLQWSTFDWVDIRTADAHMVEAIRRGLHGFTETRDFDFNNAALAILENIDSPWDRLAGNPARHEISPDASIDAFWIPAITDPRNINAHYAMLRSAWEGAVAFLATQDSARAQQAADACAHEIFSRGGTKTPSP